MTARKKGEVCRIRPFEGDQELAVQIAKVTNLELIEVMSQALHAGLKAIKANGSKMTLPLELQVVEKPPTIYPAHRDQAVLMEEKPPPMSAKKGGAA